MSQQELRRSQYIEQYIGGNILFSELLTSIHVSLRQGRRIIAKYRKGGPSSLVHGLRGKPSNHSISLLSFHQIQQLIEEKYSSFGPTFVQEKLQENHGISVSSEKVRQIMIELGFWKPRKRKKENPPFHLRTRKECYGAMIQFDGTYHIWLPDIFPKEPWCLLVAIDDATSQVVDACFCMNEGIEDIFPFWNTYIQIHGVPESIYTDRFSTYKNNHPESPDIPTQFGRVCNTLGIQLIFALTPQAKGRVERVNRTLQDRLIAEMKLAGIKNMDEANTFLKEIYIPKHNVKFSVLPTSETNMHRELRKEESENRDTLFSIHSERKVMNDYTISFKNQLYQLHAGGAMIFRGEQVRVEERIGKQGRTGEIVITQREKNIPFTKIEKRPERGYKAPLPPRRSETPKLSSFEKTGKHHPWMQNFTYSKQKYEASMKVGVSHTKDTIAPSVNSS